MIHFESTTLALCAASLAVAIGLLLQVYRKLRPTFRKSSFYSGTPLLTWLLFIGALSFGSMFYYETLPSVDSPSTIILCGLAVSTTLVVFSSHLAIHLLLHVLICSSWIGTVHQFLSTEKGTTVDGILKPQWIIPVLCNTSLLLLAILKVDINVNFVGERDVFAASGLLAALLHIASLPAHSDNRIGLHLSDGKVLAGLVVCHLLYWLACRHMMRDDSDRSAASSHHEFDGVAMDDNRNTKANSNFKRVPSKKHNNNNESVAVDMNSMPEDCVEITLEEAIRLTTPPALRQRRGKSGVTELDTDDDDDENEDGIN